ncbi:hypothetical protein LZ554_003934 [Drepanopeziza brunnea f. sp. 'monogermtubi']|nr:hypothetical protein LZ554_003934 [Drepanopeziza brunnea f. sp. 'monogermtubi']
MSDYGECTLTPQARAFSSILSAFIGSVVNGLTSGWLIAFITGWITWLAFFRVVIGGAYMLYRGLTASWPPDDNEQYEMLNRASSPDPEANAQLLNHGSEIPRSENRYPPPYQSATDPAIPNTNNYASSDAQPDSQIPEVCRSNNILPGDQQLALDVPTFGQTPVSREAVESYHRHVYNRVFGPDGSLIPPKPKESPFGTFWPTRADIAARQQNIRLAQQKRAELRKLYVSDRELQRGIAALSCMSREGKLPGPPPDLVFWEPGDRDVTYLGWVGWVYSAVYSPISQIIWVAANASASNTSGVGKIVKGISVAVTALPLCLDTRVRFAASLQTRRFGGDWAYHAFNIANAVSCLLQGIMGGVLLVWGVIQARTHTDPFFASSFPWPIVGIYPFFSLIWAWASFKIVPMTDGGRKRAAQSHWAGYLVDIGMGAFAGLFVAAPAFGLYFSNASPGEESSGAADLGAFLRCEVPTWQKFSAIFP